jgi:hypothetical protein
MLAKLTHPSQSLRQALTDYARGPVALLPGVVLLLVIRAYATLGQWESGRVLALGLGMTGSMLITGGFVQAVSRRGSLYLGLGNRRAASQFLRVTTRWALACVVAAAVLAILLMAALGLFTPAERFAFGLAFAGLGAIWLLAAGLVLVQAPGWLGAGLTLGLVAGIATDRITALISSLHLTAGTVIGFVVTLGIIWSAVNRGLDSNPWEVPGANRGKPASSVRLPSISYLAYEAAPYLAYGSLYTLLILLPHLLGWLGALGPGQDRLGAMNGIEMGLTLALLPMALAGGVAERTLRLFWGQTKLVQAAVQGHDPRQFGEALIRFYRQKLQLYLAIVAGGSLAAYLLFQAAWSAGLLNRWLQLSDLNTAAFVFRASLIAYCLLGWSSFNCMFAITMGRPRQPLRAALVGIVTLLVVGIPLSLGLHFSYAALAFIAGTAAFAWASTRSTRQLLRSADYYYFSSF